MNYTPILQDPILNKLRKEKVPCIIFTMNGFQIRGAIKGFDNFVLVIEGKDKSGKMHQQMIYKHAISTIVPASDISENVDGNN